MSENEQNNEQPKPQLPEDIKSAGELKEFLLGVRDKMSEGGAAPIYSVSAMNYVLNMPRIYEFMDNENKEIARDIWLRLRQSGLQLRNPPLLFGEGEQPKAEL